MNITIESTHGMHEIMSNTYIMLITNNKLIIIIITCMNIYHKLIRMHKIHCKLYTKNYGIRNSKHVYWCSKVTPSDSPYSQRQTFHKRWHSKTLNSKSCPHRHTPYGQVLGTKMFKTCNETWCPTLPFSIARSWNICFYKWSIV